MVVLLRLIHLGLGGGGRSAGSGSSSLRDSADPVESSDLYGLPETALFAALQPFRNAQILAIAAGRDVTAALATVPLTSLFLTGLPIGLLSDFLLTAGLHLSLQRPPLRTQQHQPRSRQQLGQSSSAASSSAASSSVSWDLVRLLGFNAYACAVTQPLRVLQLRQVLCLLQGGPAESALTAARAVYTQCGWRGFFAGLWGRGLRHCTLVLAFLAAAKLRRLVVAKGIARAPRALAGAPSRTAFPSAVYCLAAQLLHPLTVWEVSTVAAVVAAVGFVPMPMSALSYAAAPAQTLAACSLRLIGRRG